MGDAAQTGERSSHAHARRMSPPRLSDVQSSDPDPRKPMPRDHRGWRVAPAPDGRGAPDPPKPKPPHRSRWFVWFVLALLAFNLASVFLLSPGGQQRVKVPFSPYFLSAGAGRPGRVDRVQGRHDPGHVQVAGALPARRREGHADDAVRDPGPELLEQRPADRAAAGPRASRSTRSRRPRPRR